MQFKKNNARLQKEMTNKLRGLEKVTEFIKLVLASANIEGERPLSLLLVAPVSNGKTTAVKQFIKNKTLLMTTDTTAYGILEKYSDKLEKKEIKTIVIPDLLNVLSRRKTTVDTFILFINASSEDGLFPSKTFAQEIKNYISPFGWILCITKEAYERKRKFLSEIGFLSRFFVIEYQYSQETIKEILDNIINEREVKSPEINIKNCKGLKKIKGNPKIFEELAVYSRLMAIESEGQILRMQKKLQTLVKASAYLRGDNKVTNEDLDKLREIIDLIK